MNFQLLDQLMDRMLDMGIPSADLVVTVDHKPVYRKIVGFADYERTKPIDDKTLYWCFSTTKVVTCVLAMRLVEEGKLLLDAPVSDYLPEYKDVFVQNKDRSITRTKNVMTVRHLFSMTSGLNYNQKAAPIQELVKSNPNASTREVVAQFVKTPLEFEPGTHYRYSLSHDVLAAVCEVASGMRFSDYLHKVLVEPLGLVDFGFRPTEEQKSRFAMLHTYKNGLGISVPRENENPYILSDEYDSGGAGLFASVSDFIKVISTVACDGVSPDGYRLLKPETIAMMQVNQLCDDGLQDFAQQRLYGYGWGLCGRVHMNPITSHSLAPVGEFGWDGAAAAFSMVDATNHIAMYFGCHTIGSTYAYNILHPMMRNYVYMGLKD